MEVTAIRRGNLLILDKPLELPLTYVHRKLGGYKRTFTRVKLYSIENGKTYVPFGLKQRCFRYLQTMGYDIHYRVESEPQLGRIDYGAITGHTLREDQLMAIAHMIHSEGGIIEAPTGWGKSYVLAYFVSLYPDATIAVVAPSLDILHTLQREFEKRGLKVGMVHKCSRQIQRITLCSAASLHKLNPYKLNMCIFDEVHRAGGPHTSSLLAHIPNAKMLGLSASPIGRSDGTDMRVEALFGPVIYRVSYQEAVVGGSVSPIVVAMIRVPYHPAMGSLEGLSTVNLNRYGIWTNPIRNEIIAATVRKIPKNLQVLIYTDVLEHVLALKKLLPECAIYYATDASDERRKYMDLELEQLGCKLDDNERMRIMREFEQGKLKRVITTRAWSTGVNFRQLDVLVRCDGLASRIANIQVGGRVSRTNETKPYGLIIDFYDEYFTSLTRRSTIRMSDYGRLGWRVNLVDSLPLSMLPQKNDP